MAKFAQGRFALSISDRSGLAFPYTEMVREWNGAWVHTSDIDKANLPCANLAIIKVFR